MGVFLVIGWPTAKSAEEGVDDTGKSEGEKSATAVECSIAGGSVNRIGTLSEGNGSRISTISSSAESEFQLRPLAPLHSLEASPTVAGTWVAPNAVLLLADPPEDDGSELKEPEPVNKNGEACNISR